MTLQDPYYTEMLKPDNTIATIQANDFVDHEINATMITARYEADEWNRYDGLDEFLNFKAEILRDENRHDISSDKAFYQNDIVKFTGNVTYKDNKDLKFVSEEVMYNTKTKIANSDEPFVMTQNNDKIVGKSIIYDTNLKRTYARGIEAWVQQKR